MIKLNLGCGENILNNFLNYDLKPKNSNVEFIDLNDLPLPFNKNYADIILLSHVLEHINVNKLEFITELHRILKKDGILIIKIPVFSPILEHETVIFSRYYFNSIVSNPIRFINSKKIIFNSKHKSTQTKKMFKIIYFKEHFLNRFSPLSIKRLFQYEFEFRLRKQ